MEIVHFDPNGDFAEYEELTLKKDQFEKEADLYLRQAEDGFRRITV